jgi:dTDP-4-amino-4,6-dideoxygalactose transaminase
MKIINYGRQYIDSSDLKKVSLALKQKFITSGNYVKKFEKKIKFFLNVNYAVSCNSGTAALHLAFMSIDLKKNDIVIMPIINFIASYNMAKLLGAKIYFADVDKYTGQMTPQTILECVKKNKIKKIKAIIVMYLGGYPENILEFYKIKKNFNCYLIEDACHALGAKYLYKKKYQMVGSCKHADISTFSLHPVKTITAGEGGVITTNNKEIFKKIINLRSHFIQRKNKYWIYDIKQLGFNYRLSDINCSLALSQLEKINKFINYRKKIYNFYQKELLKLKNFVYLPRYNENNKSSYHLFIILINFKKLKASKDNFINFLNKKKIYCQFHYIPIYKFSFYKSKIKNFYGAEKYYNIGVSIPIYYNLKKIDQKRVINSIFLFFKKYIK